MFILSTCVFNPPCFDEIRIRSDGFALADGNITHELHLRNLSDDLPQIVALVVQLVSLAARHDRIAVVADVVVIIRRCRSLVLVIGPQSRVEVPLG